MKKKSTKRKAGGPQMEGVAYKFYHPSFKTENDQIVRISMGKDVLTKYKWRAGIKLSVKFDKKNQFKMIISKVDKDKKGYKLQTNEKSLSAWIALTWKNTKIPAAAFKKKGGTKARTKDLKAGLQIELVNLN